MDMALIKLAAAGAAAYWLYRMITQRSESSDRRTDPQPATASAGLAGGPTTAPTAPVAQGGPYVPPT
jgi:hypothetical protein